MKRYTLILLLATMTVVGCRQTEVKMTSEESVSTTMVDTSNSTTNAIYHWKTTFAPDYKEWEFLHRHNITRLYIHMFDVVAERNYEAGGWDVVPIATPNLVISILRI